MEFCVRGGEGVYVGVVEIFDEVFFYVVGGGDDCGDVIVFNELMEDVVEVGGD